MFREYCCRTAGDAHVEFEAGSAAGQRLRHNHKAKFYSITKAGKRQMKLEGLFYDLRFALRGLRRDRAFTLGRAERAKRHCANQARALPEYQGQSP